MLDHRDVECTPGTQGPQWWLMICHQGETMGGKGLAYHNTGTQKLHNISVPAALQDCHLAQDVGLLKLVVNVMEDLAGALCHTINCGLVHLQCLDLNLGAILQMLSAVWKFLSAMRHSGCMH